MKKNPFEETGKALTEDDLRDVEKALGYELPAELRSHYLEYNGGEPKRRILITDDAEFELQTFRPMKYPRFDGDITVEQTVATMVRKKRLIPEELLPFAVGSGGDFYCIDRRTQKVVFYAMDHADNPKKATSKVASSLKKFLGAMVTEEEAYG